MEDFAEEVGGAAGDGLALFSAGIGLTVFAAAGLVFPLTEAGVVFGILGAVLIGAEVTDETELFADGG
jgi:hypothetical protein